MDLLVQNAYLSPASVAPGGTTAASCYLNALTNVATVGYYLSTNQVLDASDRLLGTSVGTALGANLNDTRQLAAVVPGNVVPGAYYVLFVADPLNAVTETNESNNLAALPLTVTQALVNREQTAGYTVSVVPNPVANGGLLRVRLSWAGPTVRPS